MFDKILPNTDNFFKYLLTIGIVLIFFAILYPLQKQEEIDIKINDYNKNLEVYNYKVDLLEKETNSLQSLLNETQKKINELDSLKKINPSNSDYLNKQMLTLKNEFDAKKEIAVNKGEELKMAHIGQKYEYKKIDKMKSYLSSYFIFKVGFLFFGILLSFFGIRFWAASAYLDENLKAKDLDPTYKHSYVRCLNWVKKYFPKF